MPSADKDILYRVAYEEAVRALAEQQAEIDSFRSRAGLLLSTAAISTSFLGAPSLEGGSSHWTAWLGLLAFVGVAVVSLAILWPHRWELTTRPGDLIEAFMKRDDLPPIGELHRGLSVYMQDSYAENRTGLEQLSLFLQVASGLLTIEVVIWIAALAFTP